MKAFFLLIFLFTIPMYGHTQIIWFDDIKDPIEISQQTAESILIEIKEYLFNEKQLSNLDIYTDIKPRIVFLSLGNDDKPATVVIGSGNGLKQAINNALSKIDINALSTENTIIRVDIVQKVMKVMASENTRMDLYDQSLYGIAFDKKSEYALLPDQLIVSSVFTEKNKLNMDALKERLGFDEEHLQKASLLTLYRYDTISYLYNNNKTFSIYRGHKVFNSVLPEELLASAYNAGGYLLNAINHDGSFVYSYDPSTNKISDKYNILRHAGTIYSLLQLYEINRSPKILDGIEVTIKFMLNHIKECKPPAKEHSLCLIHNNKIKLGANALAIIALTKYAELTNNNAYTDTINMLGQWMLDTMANNGKFTIHKQYQKSGKISDFISEYYPGEATLALLALYKWDNNKKWLDAASSAIDYIIEQQKQRTPPHDHWLLYSLTEIYKIKPKQKYLTHSKYIAEEIIHSQNLKPDQPDWKGSYIKPESAATATRTEGLIAAYELSNHGNDGEYKKQLLNSIIEGLSFQQQMQFDEATTMYFEKPKKVINAFKRSLTSSVVRIDYSQHNISSFLGYYKITKQ